MGDDPTIPPNTGWKFRDSYTKSYEEDQYLASQDALEVMGVTHSLTDWTLADLTDVTLANDDTF